MNQSSTILSANVTLMVKDMDRAVEFYTITLGLKAGKRYGNHWAEIEAPGVLIGLHPKPKQMPDITIPDKVMSIGFLVEDLEKAKLRLSDSNIVYYTEEDSMMSFAMFEDPDGNRLYFSQYKK